MNAFWFGTLGLGPTDWAGLFIHFTMLSLLAVGGAITTVPDMHRYVVVHKDWLSDAQLSASVALAQAAPGPNVLFVAVIGFNVAGMVGVLATLGGSLLPSAALAIAAGRYGRDRQERRAVRAFTQGLAPLTIGLLVATSWILTDPTRHHGGTWVLFAATLAWMLRTRFSPLWPIAAGAVAGVCGWV
ncbi:MAG: chromate transporter [Rubrivivax sp.]